MTTGMAFWTLQRRLPPLARLQCRVVPPFFYAGTNAHQNDDAWMFQTAKEG